ncbi:hypothetical protein HDU93_002073, partial [Gonapodya sp. JEL0774]
MSARTIEFYYNITCPWSYIASKRLEKIAQRIGVTIIYKPALLSSSFRVSPFDVPDGPHGNKARYLTREIGRTAKRFGVPLGFRKQHPVDSMPALSLLTSLEPGLRRQLTGTFFDAYFARGLDIGSPSILQSLVSQVLADHFDIFDGVENKKWAKALELSTEEAETRGAPFSPSFWVPDSRVVQGGRMFCGADRLHFMESAVRALNESKIDLIPAPLPRIRQGPLENKRKLTFWFDFSSPWTYLGWTQLRRIVDEMGPNLELELVPTLLGIVFREIGTPVEPRKEISQQAADWSDNDMADWVSYWSRLPDASEKENQVQLKWIGGPLKGKKHFPIRTPLPLRVVCLKTEWKLIDAIFKAAWVADLDISNADVLSSVLVSAGYSPELVHAADSAVARDALKANTTRAVVAGVCGFPTYQIDNRELIWGQDKIDVVSDILLGWNPEPTRVDFSQSA